MVVSGIRMRHAPWRTAFNAGQYACSLAAAYAVTRLGPGGLYDGAALDGTDIVAIGGAGVAWFAVNYGLVTAAVRLRFGERWWPNAWHGLPFELLSTGSLLLLAPVLVTAARASAALVPLVLVPLFAVYRMARLTVEQHQLAALDPLTGLPNRKALLAEVNEQVHRHAERAARGARHPACPAAHRPGPLQERQRRARSRGRRPVAGGGERPADRRGRAAADGGPARRRRVRDRDDRAQRCRRGPRPGR
ncbi:hypothetical protein GCM10029963_31860 [Micromonospora andamanensis]